MHAAARWIAGLGLAFAAASAMGAEDLGAAVRTCRGEADATARLACYDRAVDGAQPVVKAGSAAAPKAEDNFGREPGMQAEQQQRQQQEARALSQLEATVTHIERRMDGLMTFTLDNGQVWRQNSPDSKFRLAEGDAVKIQPGAMKSFILSGPTKKSTRVSRVQ